MKKVIRTWNILRIIYDFKHSLVVNKILLIQSFLTGVLHDYFKLTNAYLKEGDKVCKCCSSLKMVMQVHLHLGFSQYFSLNVHHKRRKK